MVERVGIEPSFDPFSISNLLIRGFVYSAFQYAINKKIPSAAVREFSNDLGRIEPSLFEEKYGVPAARFKHQLRSKDGNYVFRETRLQLKYLAKDLSKAENYWNKIFARVTKKYFKDQKKRILKELENSRWYPYLEILYEKTEIRRSLAGIGFEPLYDQAILSCIRPTEKKQRARFLSFAKNQRLDHEMGWMFLRGVFCSANKKTENKNCISIDTIQRVKIKAMPYTSPPLPQEAVEVYGSLVGKEGGAYCALVGAEMCGELADRLDALLDVTGHKQSDLYPVFSAYEYVMDTLEKKECKPILESLEKMGCKGSKQLCTALRSWKQKLPTREEHSKTLQIYGPQTLYPLGFLPAVLAYIYLMEKSFPELMKDMKAALIYTTVRIAVYPVITPGREDPKELGDYMKLIEVLNAKEIGENLYLVNFSR